MGNKPKKTVVILAEAPIVGYRSELEDPQVGQGRQVARQPDHGPDIPIDTPRQSIEELASKSEFVKQANHWKRKHSEFNVVVLPYYAGTEKNNPKYSLENVVLQTSRISDISGGKVTIGIMGHSGLTMGGYPISDVSSEWRKNDLLKRFASDQRKTLEAKEIYWKVKSQMDRVGIKPNFQPTEYQQYNMDIWFGENDELGQIFAGRRAAKEAYMDLLGYELIYDIKSERQMLSPPTVLSISVESSPTKGHVLPASTLGNAPYDPYVRTDIIIDNFTSIEELDERRKYIKGEIDALELPDLISSFNSISSKIEGVMIGACYMGFCHPKEMQDMASTLGVPVYAQSGTSWGTGAIETIGDEPYEKFFVVGKDDAGLKFIPFKDVPIPMIRSTDPQEKADRILYQWHGKISNPISGLIAGRERLRDIAMPPGLRGESEMFMGRPQALPQLRQENRSLSLETGISNISDMVFDMISEQGASPLGF